MNAVSYWPKTPFSAKRVTLLMLPIRNALASDFSPDVHMAALDCWEHLFTVGKDALFPLLRLTTADVIATLIERSQSSQQPQAGSLLPNLEAGVLHTIFNIILSQLDGAPWSYCSALVHILCQSFRSSVCWWSSNREGTVTLTESREY